MKESQPEHAGFIVQRVMAELLEPEPKTDRPALWGEVRAGQLFGTDLCTRLVIIG
jgi:hypothetical protein